VMDGDPILGKVDDIEEVENLELEKIMSQ
jgi:hypothetical protein